MNLRRVTADIQITSLGIDKFDTVIARLGGFTGALAGDILTASLPASRVPELFDAPHVLATEAAGEVFPRLDLAIPAMSADLTVTGQAGDFLGVTNDEE